MSNLHALLADEPVDNRPNVDLFLDDDGHVTRSRTPRLNEERARVQYHDCRSRKSREADPRSVREIIKSQ